MRTTLLTLALACAPALAAQHRLLTDYDWDAAPRVPDSLRKGSATDVLLKRNVLAQFDDAGGDLAYYQLFHLQRYLHDQASVDQNKTMELNTGHIDRVLRIKARSVAPDGRVHDLAESAFRQATDEAEGESKLYFAFEGLEPGSLIEYIMLSKQGADIQGQLAWLQFAVPAAEQRWELLVPRGWRFAFKGYNGAPEPEADTTLAGITRHHLRLLGTEALEEERTSMPGPYRKRLVAKIDAIPERGLRDISGYNLVVRNIHKNLYPELGKGTQKALAAHVKKMGLGYARDEEDRIRSLAHYVRMNFRLADVSSPQLGDLDEILRTGNCSRHGLRKLYANLLREAGIQHQVVVTCDRSQAPFDPAFEAHNYLRDYAFYFPGIDQYYDPTALGLGLGYIDSDNMGTHGLFIKSVEVNGVATGVGSVRRIAELTSDRTRHDLVISLAPNAEATESIIELENRLSGYYAAFIQNFWSYLDEGRRSKYISDQLNHLLDGASAHRIDAEHGEPQLFGAKPFILRGSVTTPQYTARAGDDVLLKVGELIGPQMEMYQEKPRKLPVDQGFNRWYDRRITVKVPPGWTVPDLSPMSIHKTLTIDGQVAAEFRSSASQAGGVITIEVVEYYKALHVPVPLFEDYRAVINAAADFNKRVLVMRPAKD